MQTLRDSIQRWRWSREAVGQLFTRDLTTDCVIIERATVLTPAWAIRTRVKFDTAKAMSEREQLFEVGLHCVGFWHTHPEPLPEPSDDDRVLAREHALAAKPALSGLVFVIVGTTPPPAGLRVWIDDGRELRMARASNDRGLPASDGGK